MRLNRVNLRIFITISTLCILLIAIFDFANPQLAYNSSGFHVWQFITAHFIHYDMKHLMTNILAFGMLLYLFPISFKSYLKALIFSLVLIDVYLYFSGVSFYVGYSGLLYIIPGSACLKYLQLKKYCYAIAIICVLILYIFIIAPESNLSNDVAWQSLKQAHLLGFIGGFLAQTKVRNSQSGRLIPDKYLI
jgi:membrane associated rhomboid family serine protease